MATILVTGGCGYVGSVLLRQLAAEHPTGTIRVLDNLLRDSHHALFDLPSGPRYEFVRGDLLDPDRVDRVLDGVDTVFHLAGLVRTPMTFENPTWMRQVNQWGTHRLAEAARRAGVARFVFASSCSVYGPGVDASEADEPTPLGPYAESKAEAERALRTILAGRVALAIVRLGTVYGDAPAVRLDGAPNRMLFDAATTRIVAVHGSGEQRRPLLHVRDAASALRFAAQAADRHDAHGPFVTNAVAASPTMLELARSIAAQDPEVEVRFADQDAVKRLTFSATSGRLRSLGWSPDVDHREAVRAFLARLGGLRKPMSA